MLVGTKHRKLLYHLILGKPSPLVSCGYFLTESREQRSFLYVQVLPIRVLVSFERVTKRKTLENANEELIELLRAKTLLVFFTENQPFTLKKNSFVKLIPGLGRYIN